MIYVLLYKNVVNICSGTVTEILRNRDPLSHNSVFYRPRMKCTKKKQNISECVWQLSLNFSVKIINQIFVGNSNISFCNIARNTSKATRGNDKIREGNNCHFFVSCNARATTADSEKLIHLFI